MLKAHGINDRDRGVRSRLVRGPARAGPGALPGRFRRQLNYTAHEGLAVSLEEVRANLARYGELNDGGVEFLEGWFRDTLADGARQTGGRWSGSTATSTSRRWTGSSTSITQLSLRRLSDRRRLRAGRTAARRSRTTGPSTADHRADPAHRLGRRLVAQARLTGHRPATQRAVRAGRRALASGPPPPFVENRPRGRSAQYAGGRAGGGSVRAGAVRGLAAALLGLIAVDRGGGSRRRAGSEPEGAAAAAGRQLSTARSTSTTRRGRRTAGLLFVVEDRGDDPASSTTATCSAGPVPRHHRPGRGRRRAGSALDRVPARLRDLRAASTSTSPTAPATTRSTSSRSRRRTRPTRSRRRAARVIVIRQAGEASTTPGGSCSSAPYGLLSIWGPATAGKPRQRPVGALY